MIIQTNRSEFAILQYALNFLSANSGEECSHLAESSLGIEEATEAQAKEAVQLLLY